MFGKKIALISFFFPVCVVLSDGRLLWRLQLRGWFEDREEKEDQEVVVLVHRGQSRLISPCF